MKNKLKIVIILMIILLIGGTLEAKFMNKFKKGFYFEKYSTAEEAKEALLKIHPIGSDVDDLVKTLEKIKMEFILESEERFRLNNLSKTKKGDEINPIIVGAIDGFFFQKTIIFGYHWRCKIEYDKNYKIVDLSIGRYPEAI